MYVFPLLLMYGTLWSFGMADEVVPEGEQCIFRTRHWRPYYFLQKHTPHFQTFFLSDQKCADKAVVKEDWCHDIDSSLDCVSPFIQNQCPRSCNTCPRKYYLLQPLRCLVVQKIKFQVRLNQFSHINIIFFSNGLRMVQLDTRCLLCYMWNLYKKQYAG